MQINKITLNNKVYVFSQIKAYDWEKSLSTYELATLTFCADWLNQKENFQITTSGSTGIPKTITITRQQIQCSVKMTQKALNLLEGYTALICLNTQYIAGMMMLARCLEINMHPHIINPDANPLQNIPQDSSFDFAAFVPLQLQAILEQTPEKIAILNKMKAILLGGAPISLKLENALQNITTPIYHTYGMTETISHIALKQLNSQIKQKYFTILKGVSINQDARGCLIIKSPTTYQQPIITNDLVNIINSQQFEWLGRIDNVINSGGVKIQLEKIEQIIEKIFVALNLNRRFFLKGIEDNLLGQKLVLYIEGNKLNQQEEINIYNKLKIVVPRYETPKEIIYTPKIQETPTGKMKR